MRVELDGSLDWWVRGSGPSKLHTVWEVCATGLFIIVLLMEKSMFCELHAQKINGTIIIIINILCSCVYVFGHG